MLQNIAQNLFANMFHFYDDFLKALKNTTYFYHRRCNFFGNYFEKKVIEN